MTEGDWQKLDGLDPASAAFPARARFGSDGIVIVRTKDGYRGVARTCPHLKASLLDAIMMGNGTMIRCAQHAFTFRLADGKGINCPGHRLQVYDVKAEDGALFARAVGGVAMPGAAAPAAPSV
jgi:nitrite reductase/ring-hydroxylating ferredoxin subunit